MLEAVLGGEWRERRAMRRASSSSADRTPIDAHGTRRSARSPRGLREAVERRRRCSPAALRRARRSLFFDLETTGLSGGAGTYAFLVGCGWFDDDGAFVTRQFLLRGFADERPLLERVADELARAGALVSFNGKSFDAPLLETRYLFHRLEWPAPPAAPRRAASARGGSGARAWRAG